MMDRTKQSAGPDQAYHRKFTVFTPTYNRAHTLPRVYESLTAQTYRDFEWLIVDDGSTDNTHELVERWRKEAEFPIRYFYQDNSGKHVVFNRGVREARGELFLTLDSDDACVAEALERFKYHWDTIPEDRKEKFTGVTCLCRDQNGRIVGNRFPYDPTDSDSLEIVYRFKSKGEKWGFQRTDLLHRFPFSQEIKRTYIPEGLVWKKIAREYKTRFVNEVLRIYWIDQPSMVHHQEPGKNAIGGRMEGLSVLNEDIDWFRVAPLHFLRSATHYSRFSFHLGITAGDQLKSLDAPLGSTLWLIALPLGFLVFLKDKFLNNKYARIVSSQQKPFKFVVSRLLWRSGLSRFLKIKQNGFYLRFYPSALSAQLWILPEDRHSDELFFRRYLRKGDRIIDVGANIGNLTAVASLAVGTQGRVYSIEAHPQIYEYLRENIRLNRFSNVETFKYALGSKSGSVVFSDQRSDDQNTVLPEGEGISVSVEKLDNLPIPDYEIALLKVDVEGYEKFVFEGASETLTRIRCIYFESSEQHFLKFGYKTADLIDLLSQHGFRCFKSVDASTIIEISANYVSERIENLIAVRDLPEFLSRTRFTCKE